LAEVVIYIISEGVIKNEKRFYILASLGCYTSRSVNCRYPFDFSFTLVIVHSLCSQWDYLDFIELPPGVNISIEYAIYPFVVAIVFVVAGSEIAPMYKFRTAITLAVLYIMFTISLFFLGVKSGYEFSFGARSAGPIIGLLVGLYIVRGKEKNIPQSLAAPSNRV